MTTVSSVRLAPEIAYEKENHEGDDNERQHNGNDDVANLGVHGDGVGSVCTENKIKVEIGKESPMKLTFVCRKRD